MNYQTGVLQIMCSWLEQSFPLRITLFMIIGLFTRSGSSLFQDIMNPSESNFNLFKNFPLLPSKLISSSSIALTTTTATTTTPITSSLSSIFVPPIISSADSPKSIPAVTNPIGSSVLTQITTPLAVTANTTTATLQLPPSELRRYKRNRIITV